VCWTDKRAGDMHGCTISPGEMHQILFGCPKMGGKQSTPKTFVLYVETFLIEVQRGVKCSGMGGVTDGKMDAEINVDGVRWEIEPWEQILEVPFVPSEDILISLGDAIACLPTIDGRKFKWAMEECVAVGEVDPRPEGN
jgi:hypothetical protein